MFYEFPADITLDEVTEVIREHNENLGVNAFLRCDKGSYIVFNYVVAFAGSFPEVSKTDPVLARKQAIIRECRGLIFSKQTGKVLSRRYQKFFNVKQVEETQAHAINWTQPHVIMKKMDGSMLSCFFHEESGRIRWGTKMGLTDVALPVEEFVDANPIYQKAAEMFLARDETVLFEWCSRKQRIVIDYPEDQLVLTAVRNNRTGLYTSYPDLVYIGEILGIPVCEIIEGTAENIEQLIADTTELIGEEGYVVRFDNGHMVKIKARDYCLIHSTKDSLQAERKVITMILEEKIDDLLPFMTEEDRKRIDDFTTAMEIEIAGVAGALGNTCQEAKLASEGDKKSFALDHSSHLSSMERSFVFALWDGTRDAAGEIKRIIAKNLGSGTKLETVRHLMGGVKWEDYRDQNVVMDA